MPPAWDKPRVTGLLDNQVLSRIERLRLNTSGRMTSRMRGEHLSGKGGNSTEFSDYRDYVAGDDIRYVDWNIFSRLRRPYLKLYHLEEEQHVVIAVDASTSMVPGGKLERARELAAAFAVMGLFGTEPVSVYAFNAAADRPRHIGPLRGRGSMAKAFRFIEGIEGGGDAPVDEAVDRLLQQHRGRGAAVLLSDFLTFGDLRRTFNSLAGAGLEPFALQILAPTEIDPELTADLRLVDSESDQTLDVTAAGDLLAIYQEYRLRYQRQVERLAMQRGGRYFMAASDTPLPTLVLDHLRRKGWVS